MFTFCHQYICIYIYTYSICKHICKYIYVYLFIYINIYVSFCRSSMTLHEWAVGAEPIRTFQCFRCLSVVAWRNERRSCESHWSPQRISTSVTL